MLVSAPQTGQDVQRRVAQLVHERLRRSDAPRLSRHRASAGEAHADRHERLPAAAGRHPVLRARDGGAPAGRLGRRVRLRPRRVGRPSTPPSRSRSCGTRAACCCPTPAARRAVAATLRRLRLRPRCGSARPRRSACSRRRCARPGAERLVATTHGHEAGWAMLPRRAPGAAPDRRRLRRRHLPRRVHPAPAGARARPARRGWSSSRLASTSRRSAPTSDGAAVRARHGLADRPVVVCVSRLVPRKGQDTLIRALPAVRREVPDAALLLVGAGPLRAASLRALADALGVADARRVHRRRAAPASCRRTTPPATCSRCRAAPAAPGWTSRGWASSTWRRPRPGCRWSPATPAARRTRCATARPATSSTAATWPRVADRLVDLLRDEPLRAAAGRRRAATGSQQRVALGPHGRRACADAAGRAWTLAQSAGRRRRARRSRSATPCCTTLRLSFSDGVSCPPASVQSSARMANLRIDSALLTALFASSIAVWISARRSASSTRSASGVSAGLPVFSSQLRQRLRVDGDQRGDERLLVADHQALADQPVRAHPVLQHRRRDVLAAGGDDQLLLAAGDPHEAVVVDLADVAGVEPAVRSSASVGRVLVAASSRGTRAAP